MIEPTLSNLERLVQENAGRRGGRAVFQSDGLHPNPRAYKHRWWVFHAGSPVEGWAFLNSDEYAINTAALEPLLAEFRSRNEVCIVYGHGVHRHGQGSPFDPDSPAIVRWAPGYDEDTDAEVEINGVMHK
jgi:hypothetical protein